MIHRWTIRISVAALLITGFLGLGIYLFSLTPDSPYLAVNQATVPIKSQRVADASLKRKAQYSIVTLKGGSERIGFNHGLMLKHHLKAMVDTYFYRYFKTEKQQEDYRKRAASFEAAIPPDYLREIELIAGTSDIPYEDILLINTFLDLGAPLACSVFMAGSGRCKNSAPLFGRNLDFRSYGIADKYDMLFHMRRKGDLAYVNIAWPGMIGALSGINEKGFAVAMNLRHGGENFEGGFPMTMMVRRLLESAETINHAMELLSKITPASSVNLAMMDRRGRMTIAEVSPRIIHYRYPKDHLLWATNGFIAIEKDKPYPDKRYAVLGEKANKLGNQLELEDIRVLLDSVNQSSRTLQFMVFEPLAMKLHFCIDTAPATQGELQTLDLRELFADSK